MKILAGKPKGNIPVGLSRDWWENITMGLKGKDTNVRKIDVFLRLIIWIINNSTSEWIIVCNNFRKVNLILII